MDAVAQANQRLEQAQTILTTTENQFKRKESAYQALTHQVSDAVMLEVLRHIQAYISTTPAGPKKLFSELATKLAEQHLLMHMPSAVPLLELAWDAEVIARRIGYNLSNRSLVWVVSNFEAQIPEMLQHSALKVRQVGEILQTQLHHIKAIQALYTSGLSVPVFMEHYNALLSQFQDKITESLIVHLKQADPAAADACLASFMQHAATSNNTFLAQLLEGLNQPAYRKHALAYLERQSVVHVYSKSAVLLSWLEQDISPAGEAIVRRIVAAGAMNYGVPDAAKALAKTLPFGINMGEAWSDAALADMQTLDQPTQKAWLAVLEHFNTTTPKPSAAWDKRTLSMVTPDFAAKMLPWLALVGKPRTFTLLEDNDKFDIWNVNIVRGMAWALSLWPSDESARVLAGLVETSLKKIPGIGPRSPKLATAGVVALGRMNIPSAVAQLAKLKTRVTFKTTLKEIEKALEAAAQRQGISKEDLEEMAVPTFGLDAHGVAVHVLGDYTLTLKLEGSEVWLQCTDTKGKVLKSPPAAIKKEHPEELKELKQAQKDLEGMLAATKVRLEGLYLRQKTWPLEVWQERYVHHLVVAAVAKRLIWTIDGVAVAFNPELQHWVDVNGYRHQFEPDAVVTLWHPINAIVTDILAWRAWLGQVGIKQPWKQAHRELYVLTAAEERTRTYSNRFAGHVLRQHQFAQLAAVRGWTNKLHLMVDDSYPPATLELPLWGLRAEYRVWGIGENYGTDTTDAGSYLRLTTDQVRFYPIDAPVSYAHAGSGTYEMWVGPTGEPTEPLPLEHIPPLVLSEVLRDVDLFVGVASIGNDPNWQDGGPEGRFREYWHTYSFGELSATANTRKDLLEGLLPRLAIRDRVSLEGKFLKVRGDIRTYNIHLGSSNILMEPNAQYLCIVPSSQMEKDTINLPFEGDRVLAVILSKAFMLAKDTAIADPTITRQLKV